MSVFEQIGEEIKKMVPDAVSEEKGQSVSVTAKLDAGVKGLVLGIDYSDSIIKINGTREYSYPINEKAAEAFQDKILEKYSDYIVYVTGQTLNINRYCIYHGAEEASAIVAEAIAMVKETVEMFEKMCVDFQKTASNVVRTEEYDPEGNVDIVDVDDSYHVMTTTAQDNEDDAEQHRAFARKVFLELAEEAGAEVDGDSFGYTDSANGFVAKCFLSVEDAEILVSVGIPVPQDVGAMYESYVGENYPELMCSYDTEMGMFTVRGYAYPDQYMPEGASKMLEMCRTVAAACVKEYEQTLAKKDSAQFASDIQQVLAEQTAVADEREKEIIARENELQEAFAKIREKEKELIQKAADMEAEKAEHEAKLQEEREQLKAREEQMQEEIRQYEKRNTSDILKIQKLADQVAALQNRQKALGQNGGNAEDTFRLKSKIQQLTGQKIMLEKKLTEKVNAKEARIRELTDIVNMKEAKIQKLWTSMGDQARSLAAEESKKLNGRIEELEKQVEAAGHALTPDELIVYLRRDPDLCVRKLHSATARFVAWQDGQLDIRVRFGDTNYADVSCEASLKDSVLRKLNAKALGADGPDIKFFSKDKQIVARAYFGQSASAREVEQLIEGICMYFNK